MFTGIIEEIGKVKKVQFKNKLAQLVISAKFVTKDTKNGDSVSVNGVCLTVTGKSRDSLTFDVVDETLSSTNLAFVNSGDHVNLERALRLSDRMSGHVVTGHIDTTAVIKKIVHDAGSTKISIEVPKDMKRYLIKKGSVCIDGISLTIAEIAKDNFTVAVIPHTLKVTTLGQRKAGDKINLEADVLGKYIESMVISDEGMSHIEGSAMKDVFSTFIELTGGNSICN